MDKVFESWLERQHADGMALSAASDSMELAAEPSVRPPRRFIAKFDCPTLVKEGAEVTRTDGFAVLFQFPPDYLRSVIDAARVVNLLAPVHAFHPNVSPPFICIGHVTPGTGLCELIYQVHEILTYSKYTPREDDALNRDACAWARRHVDMFPLSKTPLRRHTVDFSIDELSNPLVAGGAS